MNDATPSALGRLADLRNALAEARVDAVLVPSSDPHLSEYLPERWQARRWISGFDGSVGTLAVTQEFAGLWVDSRYWVQAEAALQGSGIALMKLAAVGGNDHVAWLGENLPEGAVLAVDGEVLGLGASRLLESSLAQHKVTVRTDLDLPGRVWRDRPAAPARPVTAHVPPYAVTTRAEKLAAIRSAMDRHRADWHVVSTLDDIAWLFGLRGSDVDFNPVFLAHALIGRDSATLFLNEAGVDAATKAALARDGVSLAPYAGARAALAGLAPGSRVLVDPARITMGFAGALPAGVVLVEAINPSTLAKSRKTPLEAGHVRETMRQDGAALCEFFAWLEGALAKGEALTELTIDREIRAARARRPGYLGPSFSTIAGWNANAAMPHYRATEESHAKIEGSGLLLIDSGGQYPGGTTDITRVVPVGTITPEHKRDYTLVLKGMIALSLAKFPRGTKSALLDTIARAPIWAAGANYGHGTGHGVGYALCVHEGPQSISPGAVAAAHTEMEPGMITSNEPGLYRPGRWGIRIENLVLAVSAETTEFGEFLAFETLTLCPIDTHCIELAMLVPRERLWLDAYHAQVRERLEPLVEGAARAWLLKSTEPLRP